jgi:hypothetical protein
MKMSESVSDGPTLSNFQIYWRRLKQDDPQAYESRLKVNRDRLKNIRKQIYENPERHKKHLETERARYRRRRDTVLAKTSD